MKEVQIENSVQNINLDLKKSLRIVDNFLFKMKFILRSIETVWINLVQIMSTSNRTLFY